MPYIKLTSSCLSLWGNSTRANTISSNTTQQPTPQHLPVTRLTLMLTVHIWWGLVSSRWMNLGSRGLTSLTSLITCGYIQSRGQFCCDTNGCALSHVDGCRTLHSDPLQVRSTTEVHADEILRATGDKLGKWVTSEMLWSFTLIIIIYGDLA